MWYKYMSQKPTTNYVEFYNNYNKQLAHCHVVYIVYHTLYIIWYMIMKVTIMSEITVLVWILQVITRGKLIVSNFYIHLYIFLRFFSTHFFFFFCHTIHCKSWFIVITEVQLSAPCGKNKGITVIRNWLWKLSKS